MSFCLFLRQTSLIQFISIQLSIEYICYHGAKLITTLKDNVEQDDDNNNDLRNIDGSKMREDYDNGQATIAGHRGGD